jgi:hypothetical protein
MGKLFARWVVKPEGRFELALCNSDNSTFVYNYKKTAHGGDALVELLRKYAGPEVQTWDNGEKVPVYFLDPLHFEAFKAKIDAMDEFYHVGSFSEEDQSWIGGKSFATWSVRPDGMFELDLYKSDNSHDDIWYKKVPHTGDTWEEKWNEGRITFTYLGLTDPGFIADPEREGDGTGAQYKGYYKIKYHDWDGRTVYLYYPETGWDGQYSKPLD